MGLSEDIPNDEKMVTQRGIPFNRPTLIGREISYLREAIVPRHNSPGGQRFGRVAGTMEVTLRTSETLVRLPMFFELGSQIEEVIDAALDYFGQPETITR